MTQTTNFELVGDFMNSFGQEVNFQPELVDQATSDLRVDLISEELEELQEAIKDNDLIEIADALTDLLYVVYGAGHTYGIDLDECFKEVHRSNMSKLGQDGKPIYREDGKVLKGPGFFNPDLKSVIF
jgi:predicted HAD superfamily Cof-like phosphohydrolase